MKRNKDFILRKVAGDTILVPVGEASQQFNGLINLSTVAEFIWEHLEDADNEQEMVELVLNTYDIDEKTANEDVYGFIKALDEWNMIIR